MDPICDDFGKNAVIGQDFSNNTWIAMGKGTHCIERVDGVIGTFSGVASLGPACCLPFYLVPNRFSIGDDLIWTSGAHTIKLGAGATRFRVFDFDCKTQQFYNADSRSHGHA